MSQRLAEAVVAEGVKALCDRIALRLCGHEAPHKRCEDCRRLRLPCYTRNEERARIVVQELLDATR